MISLLAVSLLSPVLAGSVYQDLRIQPHGASFDVYDANEPVDVLTFARIMDDREVISGYHVREVTRNQILGLGGVAMGGAAALTITSIIMFSVQDFRYNRSIRDPLFGDPGPPYTRNYTPARTVLAVGAGTALVGTGLLTTSLVLKKQNRRYTRWYTEQQAEELIASYNTSFSADVAHSDGSPPRTFRWDLVERNDRLEIRNSGGAAVDAERFAFQMGDAAQVRKIRASRVMVTAAGAAIVLGGLNGAAYASDRAGSESPIAAVIGLAGVGAGAGVIVFGRQKVEQVDTWYTAEELESGVEAYNASKQAALAPLPESGGELSVQLGIVPGGVGLAAAF